MSEHSDLNRLDCRSLSLADIMDEYLTIDALERTHKARENHSKAMRDTQRVHRQLTGGR